MWSLGGGSALGVQTSLTEIFLVSRDQRDGRKHKLVRRQRWSQTQRPGTTGSSGGGRTGRSRTDPIERGQQRTLRVRRVIPNTLRGRPAWRPGFLQLAEDGRLRAGQRQVTVRRTGLGKKREDGHGERPGRADIRVPFPLHLFLIITPVCPHTCRHRAGPPTNGRNQMWFLSPLGSPALIGSRLAPALSFSETTTKIQLICNSSRYCHGYLVPGNDSLRCSSYMGTVARTWDNGLIR